MKLLLLLLVSGICVVDLAFFKVHLYERMITRFVCLFVCLFDDV